MAVSANLFVTDSLVGSTQVKNTFANVNIGTRPLAFIGDQSFVIKLRRNSFEGDVIATTPQITIRDNTALVSFVANTYTVAEGDLVEFTLTTTGAANNAVLYYSTLDMTPNVDATDFFGANAGSFTLVDNVGKIVLQANADGSLTDETGETFKLQVRTGSVTGNVVLVSDNVSILDISNVSSYFISETSTSVVEGSNVTFTIGSINVPDGTEIFYTTAGNVRSYNFTTGNTGSRILVNGSNTIDLVATAIPNNETREFILQIREGSTTGQIITSSQNIIALDSALNNIDATGGTIITEGGYRTHIFTSTSNLNIISTAASPITTDLLIVAGGGGGGVGNGYASSGGGAGGLREITHIITAGSTGEYTMVVGAGGASVTSGNASSAFGYVSAGGGGARHGNVPPPFSPGSPGGSGAGGMGGFPKGTAAGTAGTGNDPPVSPSQGNPGGNAGFIVHGAPSNTAGGGGGAGAPGGSGGAPTTSNGVGGVGKAIPWMPASYGTIGPAPGRWFAGGGGTGGNQPFGTLAIGVGGAGGGGNGSGGTSVGNPGAVNTGGGAGGGSTHTASAGGIGGSGIIAIRYPLTPIPTFALTESSISIFDSQSITFSVLTTNVANNYVLYYRTSGNVSNSDFVQGNTGSFAVVDNVANITLAANLDLAEGETRVFSLQILEGAVDGDVILTSNIITVNPSPLPIQATGGTVDIVDGTKRHIFTTSGVLEITHVPDDADANTINYVLVAGGGSAVNGGGGAGGMILSSYSLIPTSSPSFTSASNITVVVGAGSSARAQFSPQIWQNGNGNNTYITLSGTGGSTPLNSDISYALGGGAGGLSISGPAEANGVWGGSGGGGGGFPGALGPGHNFPGPTQQGYPGGLGGLIGPAPSGRGGGAGGGGAGGAGAGGPWPGISGGFPIAGGIGRAVPFSPPSYGQTGPDGQYFAGGGGGGANYNPGVGAPFTAPVDGGLGGGGQGSNVNITSGDNGVTNTGGGGGGQTGRPAPPSGLGGSGIVIISYPWN